jgi:deoxyribodipyrimidine photo-lyase
MQQNAIMWFRRDLRLFDNCALYNALNSGLAVIPIFIFDTNILNDLKDKRDKRIVFIHEAVTKMYKSLQKINVNMQVHYGNPLEVLEQICNQHNVAKIFTNTDYEPYAINREAGVTAMLQKYNATLHTFKDQVIFEKNEVTKDDGLPYTVFTPYSKKWKAALQPTDLESYNCKKYFENFNQAVAPKALPTIEDIGFKKMECVFPKDSLTEGIAKNYHDTRDIPSIAGTTELSVHLRFGTISVRQLTTQAKQLNEKYLNELIWREFYQQILWHFPHVVGSSFKPKYDAIQWRNNEADFEAWCQGKTGYPIVDAGMRQLNETGWMHNRVRMIVASFLTKHLLIDWRWGEAYFAKKLLDFELASNNGGWQWASGSGVDAAPYFRVFNPYIQTKKFDEHLAYIKKWVPELETLTYPMPIVEHTFARDRCLKVYKNALGNQE